MGLLIVSALVSSSPSIHAETSKETRALLKEAEERYKAQDFAGAAARFDKVLEQDTASSVALQAARSHLRLGHLLRAQALYRGILRNAASGRARLAGQERRVVQEAEAELDELLGRIPQLRLVAKGPFAADVRLKVNGTPASQRDWYYWLSLEPGSYRFGLESDGFEKVEVAIEIKEGDRKLVEVQMKPLPKATPGWRTTRDSK